MIHVVYAEGKGRGLVAGGSIRKGTVVLRPSCVMDAVVEEHYCSACKCFGEDVSECGGCSSLFFCGDCLEKAAVVAFHARECQAIASLRAMIEEGGLSEEEESEYRTCQMQQLQDKEQHELTKGDAPSCLRSHRGASHAAPVALDHP